VITGNVARHGGGVDAFVSFPHIEGCTISANFAEDHGGGVSVPGIASQAHMERTIVWGNGALVSEDEMSLDPEAIVWMTCCDVNRDGIDDDGEVVYVADNIFVDPLFCDPASCEAAPTTDGDHHLGANSPCLPAHSPCGELIGALGEGCSAVPARDLTWGAIKRLFQR
jgi:hypothetical protein